jgi:hypothetical protein
MNKARIMEKIDQWADRSRKGEVCGILGCPGEPVVKCDHCGNNYCALHAGVINTPAHQGGERDREEFERAGYPCLVLRNPEMGMLCGYVGVKKGHPCYGKDYELMPYDDLFSLKVHGGLTFSGEGDGSWRPAGYWWLGFDCGHFMDRVPFMEVISSYLGINFRTHGTYRDFKYVKQETIALSDQVAILEFIDWQFTWVWPLLLPRGAARRIWARRRNINFIQEDAAK